MDRPCLRARMNRSRLRTDVLCSQHRGESWAFVLQNIDERNTRLIIRERFSSSLPTAMQVLNYILEPGYFIMCRKMLLGIRERAEQTVTTEQVA